ncbi:Xaa-Pro peptidase family protein [Brevundimonas diminuta]|uniref:M24 family metallopeptidase n=1 Tax=Brevundimonas diminuta TaxID=293 RepID=UPI002096A452|nr:Xaa-Pro peptidase family protein [Brevundimonas diminuta]MCO8019876.1 Xaa-Pro peptidase family protein [Brevundimonas diminuta]MCO8023151.1 Xaa-Pro peptidase family protein [Brevundimonas diminuta]
MTFLPPSATPITVAERQDRIAALAARLKAKGLAALLVGPTASLRYYTGLDWHPSERLTGGLIHADGRVQYICPRFELDKVAGLTADAVAGDILTWEEEESPYVLAAANLPEGGVLAIDDQAAAFIWLGLSRVMGADRVTDGGPLIVAQRSIKSAAEIALLTRAKAITLEVQRRTRHWLKAGVRTSEVKAFIDAEHRALGGEDGSWFCLVSFGEDTCLPHGGEGDRALAADDVVLIDTGTLVDGYHSDITRTYVFGQPSEDFRRVWAHEKEAQARAFAAAAVGAPCASVDAAARDYLTGLGYGPDYRLPGLPHRTGHGIGLDIHEAPNLVRGDATPLAPGMCFSNEPMLVIPGQYGVRLEDHFYMTEAGPVWFTEPSHSLDDPFGEGAAA